MEPDDLYGLPLDRFVPERNALARELRQAGQREAAEAVGALRKPSIAAWAVNQLVRTQSRAVAELFRAGDTAQHAQAQLLSGRGDANALRDALSGERTAVDELGDVARGLLSSAGHELSSAMLERVADTLHAAALDEESRAEVSDGRLERELRHVGLGGLSAAKPAASGRSKAARPAKDTAALRKRQTEAPRKDTAALRKAARPAKDTAALRKAEAAARRAADRAARDLAAARDTRDAAAEALAQAEGALAAAQEKAAEADSARELARRELESA